MEIDRPIVFIGEKNNPTGNEKMAVALSKSNLDFVHQQARVLTLSSAFGQSRNCVS